MNKKRLHHFWRLIGNLSIVFLAIAFIVAVASSIISLRNNNLMMVKLRNEVYAADKANGDVEGALRTLRAYVAGHMNTNLLSGSNPIKPPIQLKYSYEREVETEKARATAVNDKVYNDAQNYCEQQFPKGLSGSGRVPCVQNYVTDHGAKERPVSIDFYTFDFVSPRWTPDLAGLSLVVAAVLGILLFIRLAVGWWVNTELHDHL